MKTLIIISGITGAGKTTLVEKRFESSPHLHFDDLYGYQTKILNYDAIVQMVKSNPDATEYILDAFIFDEDRIFKLREKLSNLIDIFIVQYLYCPLDQLYQAQLEKGRKSKGYWLKTEEIEARTYNIFRSLRTVVNIKYLKSKGHIDKLIFLFRSKTNYTQYEDEIHFFNLMEHNMKTKKELLKYIDDTTGDPKYQTIVVNGEKIRSGYSKSEISWANILATGIDFKDKNVCDVGCFIGYFCFRCEEMGAKNVTGLDKNNPAILGAKQTAVFTSSKCVFNIKDIGKDKIDKPVDIIFALNMLHHIKKDSGLDTFNFAVTDIFDNCKEAIFEVNEVEVPDIEAIAQLKNFVQVKAVPSHRKTQYGDRVILYYKNV